MMNPKMTITRGSILICAMVLLCMNSFLASAQEQEISKTETEFTRIRAKLEQLNNRRITLDQQIKERTSEIQTLRHDDDLNYFQRQRLEDLLKDAQSISNEIERIDRDMRALREKRNRVGTKLLDLYDADINKRLHALEQEELASEAKQRYLQQIESLREKQVRIKQELNPDGLGELKLSKLQIDADDSPREIELKADLLKDQEEKLRRFADKLEGQTKELKKELNLRTRINDLVTDIALFDQQEEALTGASSQQRVESVGPIEETGDLARRTELQSLPLSHRDFNFSSLSTDQLEILLERMAKQKAHAEATADSLGQQADKFYRAAQENKKE